jgi:membrane protease YdiL (CAAX protease family)
MAHQFVQPFERVGREAYALGAYIGFIAVAEGCIAFVSPFGGTIVYSLLLVVMLTHSVGRFAPEDARGVDSYKLDSTTAIHALAFLPVLRLVSVTAPVGGGSAAGRYLLVSGILLAAIGWGVWVVRLPIPSLRPQDAALEIRVVGLAVPLMFAAYFVIRPDSFAAGSRWTQLGAAALAAGLAAIVEELIFRGIIQSAFARLYGGAAAPVCATALYVVSYLGARPLIMIVYAGVLGLLFGWIVQRTRSLLGVVVSHALLNVGLFVLLPQALSSSPVTR